MVLDIICSICRVTQLVFSAAAMGPAREHQSNVGITPCGHMFCWDCLRDYKHQQDEDDEVERCPLCRFEFMRACGHIAEVVQLDPARPLGDQVPPTLPEGGRIQPRCDECEFLWVREFLRWETRRLLLPKGCACEADEPMGANAAEPCSHLRIQTAFDRFSGSLRDIFLDIQKRKLKW